MITVMRDRYVRAMPREGERTYALDIGYAMRRPYRSDAHFAQYASPHGRRLSRESLAGGARAVLHAIALDIDCRDVHGTPEPAPETWRRQTLEIVRAIAADHGPPYYYGTRGGARVVYRLPVPSFIATSDDESAWSLDYLVTIAYLRRRYGLMADVACSDWTRLFRLPRSTRDGRQEAYETRGNPDQIAELCIEPSSADLAAAREIHRPSRPAVIDPVHAEPGAEGELYAALAGRGDVIRRRGHAYVIRCPRDRMHSSGRAGDGSSLLYPPVAGKTLGHIHCLHSGCVKVGVRDWLRELGLGRKGQS